MSERRGETFACGLSRQVAEAEGSLIRVVPERLGSALTKPGRASTARWGGSGERDGEEYATSRRCNALQRAHRLKSGGYGPGAARPAVCNRGGNSGEGCDHQNLV